MSKLHKVLTPIAAVVGKVLKAVNSPAYFDGMKITYPDTMTDWERGFTLLGKHEENERKLVKKYIHKDDAVLELGACLGVVSITTNRLLADNTRQVSVEPNPAMQPYLLKNKENNKASFFIENCIVSKEKEVEFYTSDIAFLSSSTNGSGKHVKVPGMTIEALEKKYFPFTALVMDIEGGELNLLRNFDLSESGIQKVIWETHGQTILTDEELNECYDLLRKYGFEFADNAKNVEYWKRKS